MITFYSPGDSNRRKPVSRDIDASSTDFVKDQLLSFIVIRTRTLRTIMELQSSFN